MDKGGLSTIILDSAELFRGLDALSQPRSKWSFKHNTNKYSALRLCYHFMTRDRIYYDGNVRSENVKLIEEALELIETTLSRNIADAIRFKIHGISFDKDTEKVFTKQAIKDSANYFQDRSKTLEKRFFEFDFGSGLSDIDSYLFNPCKGNYSSQRLLDGIFDKKGITGRRFYVSIFEDEEILNRVKFWIREGVVSPKDFNLMFTLFRAKLSESKSIYLASKPAISECFYEPDKLRKDLLKEIPTQNEQKVDHNKVLDQGMYNVWLSKSNYVVKSEDVDIPTILNLPLQEDSKAKFLESVLSFSRSEFKKQYDEAIHVISKTKIQNMDKTQKNLELALRSARAKGSALSDSGNWVFLSEGQDLAKFLLSTTKELGEDIATEGSVTGLLGAITRLATKMGGNGISAGTKIHKSFGRTILSMSREDRNIKLDEIFS